MSSIPVGYLMERLVVARDLLVVGKPDEFRAVLRDVVKLSGDYPVLGLDVDGVITDFPDVFRVLSNSWPGMVVIVSFRSDYDGTAKLLMDSGIYFDKLVLSSSLDKSEVIHNENINVFIDDQDECVKNVDSSVLVLKARNGGNFIDGKWWYSRNTGRFI